MESIEISAWEMTEIGKDTLKLPGSRGAIEIISMFHCSDKRVRFSELSALPRSHQYEDASLRKVLN